MPLRDRQREFVAALFDGTALASVPAHALEIHRNNLRAAFRKTLALEFPVIERLGGPAFFDGLARAYQDQHPSVSGDLHRIGATFPAYLLQRLAGSSHAYFADVAAIEWCCVEAVASADSVRFDSSSLAALSADDVENVKATLHPSVRITRTSSPALSIWRAHADSADPDLSNVDLTAGGASVLIWRSNTGLQLCELDRGDDVLLDTLRRGGTLGSAFEAAVSADPTFDLAASLQRWTGRDVIVALAH